MMKLSFEQIANRILSFQRLTDRVSHPVVLLVSLLGLLACGERHPNQNQNTTSPVLVPAPEMHFVFGQVLPEPYKAWVRDHLIPAMQARSLGRRPVLRDPRLYYEPVWGPSSEVASGAPGQYGGTSPVWLDTNDNGTFESAVDLTVRGEPSEGVRGRQNGLFFLDKNMDSKFHTSNDTVGRPSSLRDTVPSLQETDLTSHLRLLKTDILQDLDVPHTHRSKMPYFVNPNAAGFGDWHGSQSELLGTAWQDHSLLAAILGSGASDWTVLSTGELSIAGSELPVVAASRVEGELWPNNLITREQLVEMKAMVDSLHHLVTPIWSDWDVLNGSQRIDTNHRYRRLVDGELDAEHVSSKREDMPDDAHDPLVFSIYGAHSSMGTNIAEQRTYTGRHRVTLREPQHPKHVEFFVRRWSLFGTDDWSEEWVKLGESQNLAAGTLSVESDYVVPDEYLDLAAPPTELPRANRVVRPLSGVSVYSMGSLEPIPDAPFSVEFEHSLDQIRDTDRDDLVDVGFDLTEAARAGGVMTFQPEWSEPQVFIPLGASGAGSIRAAHYLHQGGLSRRSRYMENTVRRDDIVGDGHYVVYSGHTRVIPEVLINQNGVRIKRFAVVRPRGNVVSFEFPWRPERNTFDSFGHPIGINADRTYVLLDTTPNVQDDLNFHLKFASGIVHQFRGDKLNPYTSHHYGRIYGILDAEGRSHDYPRKNGPRFDRADEPVFTEGFGETPGTNIDWYVDWEEGRITTVRRVFSHGGEKSTAFHYDEQGRVTKLSKDDPSMNYELINGVIHRGATPDTSIKFSKAANIISSTLPGDGGSWSTETIFTPAGYVASVRHGLDGLFEPPTTFTYSEAEGRYSKTRVLKSSSLKKVVYPDGRWEAYEHHPMTGWVTKIKRPSKNTPSENQDGTPAEEDSMEVIVLGYEEKAPDGDPKKSERMVERPRSVVTKERGQVTGYAYHAYRGYESETRHYEASGQTPSWTSPHIATHMRETQDGDEVHRTRGKRNAEFIGVTTKDSASVASVSRTKQGTTIVQTTEFGPWGQKTSYLAQGTGKAPDSSTTSTWTLDEMTADGFDAWGRASKFSWSDGTVETLEGLHWHLGPTKRIDRQGIESEYTYTPLGQVKTVKRLGVTTTFGYDALGNVTKTVKSSDDGDIVTQATYDALGRLRSSTDGRGQTTLHIFHPAGTFVPLSGDQALAGPTKETTFPDGSKQFEHRYLDGRLRLVETLEANSDQPSTTVAYDYGADTEGAWAEEQRPDAQGNLTYKTRTYVNGLGKTKMVTQSSTLHGTVTVLQRQFDPMGRVTREVDGDGVVTLFAYNSQGKTIKRALDRNGNGIIDDEGGEDPRDVVVTFEQGLTLREEVPVFFKRKIVGTGPEAFETVEYTGVNGLQRWYTEAGVQKWKTQRTPATHGAWDAVTTTSDGQSVKEHFEHGRLQSAVQIVDGSDPVELVSLQYDTFGRSTAQTSPEGTTSFELDGAGFPQSVAKNAGETTALSYNHNGRPTQVSLPGGTTRSFNWSADGGSMEASGPGQHPFNLDYDGLGLPSFSWKRTVEGPDDVTSWHGDHGQHQKSVNGTVIERVRYTPGGRVKSRTKGEPNASDRLLSEHSYDAAGLLSSIRSLNPQGEVVREVPVAVDSAGRTKSLGNMSFTYTPNNQVHRESVPQVPGMALVRGYDASGRMTRISLEQDGTPSKHYDYEYDASGRLTMAKEGPRKAVYAYEPGTKRVTEIGQFSSENAVAKTTIGYDANGRQTSVYSRPSEPSTNVTFLKHVYSYDPLDRVSLVTQTAFDSFEAIESQISYGYDARNQLTSTAMVLPSSSGQQPVEGRSVSYRYDEIGNRTQGGNDDAPDNYVTGDRNFYLQATASGHIEISGTAHPDAIVTVSAVEKASNQMLVEDDSVERTGSIFYYRLESGLALPGQTVELAFTIALPGLGVDTVGTSTIDVIVPFGDETPMHASAGYRTEDAYHEYTWTPEGRLQSVESPLRFKTTYEYDAFGRRIARKLWKWSADEGAYPATPHRDQRYIYDNRRIIAVYNAKTQELASTYLWGPDLSGTLDGFHGVGGLAALGHEGQSFYPVTDRGGNVRTLVDGSGSVAMTYDYSPFGRVIAINNFGAPSKNVNPFLFSTKVYDFQTELYDFGLRTYDPSQGRWLSQDPLGEAGGLNVFTAFANDPINHIDALGATAESIATLGSATSVPWDPEDRAFNPANAHLAAVASRISYEAEPEVRRKAEALGFEDIRFLAVPSISAQAFTAYDPRTKTALVSFRGTAGWKDIAVDLTGLTVHAPLHFRTLGARVHVGFFAQFLALKAQVLQNIEDYRQRDPNGFKIFVAGHSLGGALAALFSLYGLKRDLPITSTYTIGQPPVGNPRFAASFARTLEESGSGFFRTVHNMDFIPNVGSIARWLTHGDAGDEIYIDRKGTTHYNPSGLTKRLDRTLRLLDPSEAAVDLGRHHAGKSYEAYLRITEREFVGR